MADVADIEAAARLPMTSRVRSEGPRYVHALGVLMGECDVPEQDLLADIAKRGLTKALGGSPEARRLAGEHIDKHRGRATEVVQLFPRSR